MYIHAQLLMDVHLVFGWYLEAGVHPRPSFMMSSVGLVYVGGLRAASPALGRLFLFQARC